MIRYNLICESAHEFEAWFNSADGFREQQKAQQVECPYCGCRNIERAPSMPAIITKGRQDVAKKEQRQVDETITMLRKLQQQIEKNFEFVGDSFALHARKLHYQQQKNSEPEQQQLEHQDLIDNEKTTEQQSDNSSKQFGIYGTASEAEIDELLEEGIDVQQIPWLKRNEN